MSNLTRKLLRKRRLQIIVIGLASVMALGLPGRAGAKETIGMGSRPDSFPVLKNLFIETDIVASGRPACAILVPQGETYAALGRRLADEIERRSRARLPVTADPSAADPARTNVIALGQMLNNRLIEKLYWNRYLFTDSAWPGGDGYCIQSVHNPYPWTAGHNVIVLGASAEPGVRCAVEEFIKQLPPGPDLRVGYLMRVALPPPDQRLAERVLMETPYISPKVPAKPLSDADLKKRLATEPTEGLVSFLNHAVSYLVTGEEGYLRVARHVLLRMCDAYEKLPDPHPTWPEETNSRIIFAMWDAVEESPVLSDADRLRITNMFLKFLYSLVSKTSGYGGLEKNDTIIWNHTTFPLMGLYWGGRYFRRYYDAPYMDVFLQKALGAFSGQERSWKPQCDADAYLTLTMGHTIEYCLAEGRMKFFESGVCRAYADYLVGISDNRGWAPGFGDSGIQRSAHIPLAGLPYAFWFYRDGRYLWFLNSITQGKWGNPYDLGVKPVPPQDMVGLRVFPLDRQVYDFTKTRSYYNEPLAPPNVPYEQAFDKISFRENLDPTGQYFILDGYGRGKHYHYDGNAILKLTQDGEDWLLDGDYLVRNTTEHNMVTVVRDGRCDQMEPVCTGLLHHADLPTRGFCATIVKDFNGAEWERFIAWRKGDWVVVTDRLRAAKPGRYGFDCVWKCIDQGSEEIVEGRRLRIARGQGLNTGHVLLDRVADPLAKRKEAFVFLGRPSQFQTLVNLPAGEYKTTLYARGVDTGADSLWVTVDWDEPVAHHVPISAIGPSSASSSKDVPSPVIKVTKSGEHLLTIKLRENPGVVLDRIVFEPAAGGAPVEIIAVQAPPAPPRPNPNVRAFHVVNADGATLSLVRRLGSSGPIKLLFQRQSATLQPGAAVTFRNLLYLDKRGEQKAYDLRPLGAQGAVLLADGRRIISSDGLDAGRLTSDAALAEIGPDCVCLVDATRLTGGRELFTASRPASVEVNLKTGAATVVTAADVKVGFAGGAKLRLSAGRHEVRPADSEVWKEEVLKALDAVGTPALPKPARPQEEQAGGAPLILWRLDPKPMTEVADIASADVDGDGRAESLVCAGRDLICLDAEGKERWRFNCKWPILCVCVADVNGDKKPEVLCGGRDKFFHVLGANGRLLAEHEMTEPLVIGQGGTRDPFVRCITAADLDGDGSVEIVAGCTNSNVSAFKGSDLTRLWTRSGIYHGAGRIALTNLDGPVGAQHAAPLHVLVSDHYGSVHIISSDGKQESRVYSELGDVVFDSGDLDGDGRQEILNGSGTGAFAAAAYPVKPLWSFNNYGYAARVVLARDLDGDGKAEAIVGLDSGYLFALGGDGKPKWQLEVGAAILALAHAPLRAGQPSVLIAGLRDGSLLMISPNGEVLRRSRQPSAVTKMLAIPAAGRPLRLLVSDESNVVRLLECVP